MPLLRWTRSRRAAIRHGELTEEPPDLGGDSSDLNSASPDHGPPELAPRRRGACAEGPRTGAGATLEWPRSPCGCRLRSGEARSYHRVYFVCNGQFPVGVIRPAVLR